MKTRTKLILRPDKEDFTASSLIYQLDRKCFPNDAPCYINGRYWWLITVDDEIAGYASIEYVLVKKQIVGQFTRVGILRKHRGMRLQRRLIKARIRHAKRMKAKRVVTYTVCQNCASANNLIGCGFKIYSPKNLWAGNGVIYWQKRM